MYNSPKLSELLMVSEPATNIFVSPSMRFKTRNEEIVFSTNSSWTSSTYLLRLDKSSTLDCHTRQSVANKHRCSLVALSREQIFAYAPR